MYVNNLISLPPSRKKWLQTKSLQPAFKDVGGAYITARVCKRMIKNQPILYEIRRLDAMFQNHTHLLRIGVLQRGIESYRALSRTASKPTWQALIAATDIGNIPPDAVLEDLVEVEEEALPVEVYPDQLVHTSLKEVEANKKFDPRLQAEGPTDLYSHSDKTMTTQIRPESTYLFTHSASSILSAYISFLHLETGRE
ncbi:LOW QUALITY PROTEIN: hypothetical protein PHMEG_00035572, partial [Phytophthora megakarya]